MLNFYQGDSSLLKWLRVRYPPRLNFHQEDGSEIIKNGIDRQRSDVD